MKLLPSISSGVIPKIWKTAHIVPLHEAGDKADINNYQPISKLPCFDKVLESLVNNQLKSLLFWVLTSLVSKLSRVLLLLSLAGTTDNIYTVNKGKYYAVLFLDLTKAFDTVDCALMLDLIVIPVIGSRTTCLIDNNVWL